MESLDRRQLNPETSRKTSQRSRLIFPAREGLPETEIFWYDGNPDDTQSVKPLRPTRKISRKKFATCWESSG